MGNELGQLREWDETREQDWDILKYPVHDSFHRFVTDMNKIYLSNPAFFEKDYEQDGFLWISCTPVFCPFFSILFATLYAIRVGR